MNKAKKIFFLAALALIIFPSLGFAIEPGTMPGARDLGIEKDSPVKDVGGLVGILASIVRWVYAIFFILTVLFVIFAAYKYLTNGGEAAKMAEVHKQLGYAAVAVIVAILATGFSFIIENFLVSPTAGLPANSSDIDRGFNSLD